MESMESMFDLWESTSTGHGVESGVGTGWNPGFQCNPSISKRSKDEAGNPCFLGTYEKEKGRLQMLANGQGRGDRNRRESARPRKNKGLSDFENPRGVESGVGSTKRGILEAFLALDESDRREVLEALEEVAAGKVAG
jgi:hypothetical protein